MLTKAPRRRLPMLCGIDNALKHADEYAKSNAASKVQLSWNVANSGCRAEQREQQSGPQQQAALDSIKAGVWDTRTKTGTVKPSVGINSWQRRTTMSIRAWCAGTVRPGKSSAIKDQTWWLTGINMQTEMSPCDSTRSMITGLINNWALHKYGYLRVQSADVGGSSDVVCQGRLLVDGRPVLFRGGAGDHGPKQAGSNHADSCAWRMASLSVCVIQLPRMDTWSNYRP
ncbi:hypothetical protein FQR65_LT18803 [Abscondita terminalis]|nr:hypothetical protein FQR65_LT18803 [Abscondita terminalis]